MAKKLIGEIKASQMCKKHSTFKGSEPSIYTRKDGKKVAVVRQTWTSSKGNDYNLLCNSFTFWREQK